MNRSFVVSLVLGSLMVSSAGLTKYSTPTIHLSESRPALVLEKVIPVQFGGWKEEKSLNSGVVNPQTEAVLKRIYTATMSRSYVNENGDHIMLSIAYGKDQSDDVQVHYPEICYPAQGFQIMSNRQDFLVTPQGIIPVTRLETNQANQRYEPVTYWTTVGDATVTGGISKKIAEIRYGLRGEIPDGLLFRISSISTDSVSAFRLQDVFVRALVDVLDPVNKRRVMGLQ